MFQVFHCGSKLYFSQGLKDFINVFRRSLKLLLSDLFAREAHQWSLFEVIKCKNNDSVCQVI